ncbi:hypothetical protein SM033_00128 [Vibrio phage vB_VpaM_sm033]|nr:hypothetical protein SM033_00128 [Vibrio phage vB_VpaM_sm033]
MEPNIKEMSLAELQTYLESLTDKALACLLLEDGENDYHAYRKDIADVKNQIVVLEEADLLDEFDF